MLDQMLSEEEYAPAEFLDPNQETWHDERLTLVVFGASGDLAKKKTYPAIFDLFRVGALPRLTIVCGYARSKMSDDEFRSRIHEYLQDKGSEEELERFLDICIYRSGQYDGIEEFKETSAELRALHECKDDQEVENRMYYLAIPPNQFLNTIKTTREGGMSETGWTRVVVEKPFGHDTESAKKLGDDIGQYFDESHLYRIDHYLGKEMVQNLVTLRFGNAFLEPLFNRDHVKSVIISFKEPFGTEGRGGYFDSYGIIRDVMQNHLMQLLSIIAMEPPVKVAGTTKDGTDYSRFVRDEKVKVLAAVKPWSLDDVVLGQYVSNGDKPGYLDDETVPEGSNQPTYAAVRMFIHNKRWDGVPFIMKAGKALDEKKCEVRFQFRDPAGAAAMFGESRIPRNELVLRLQPQESIYMKLNVKKPGLATSMVQSSLDLDYTDRYDDHQIPEAYTRLLLDVLRGKQATFVRDDELLAAWEIVTPLLEEIESGGVKPIPYEYGSRGPAEADELVKESGYVRNAAYAARYNDWKESKKK
ncbi:Glucose-6-phosphate 1-dehydrogenase [Hondaea fermentalgiana]|uniref:Glucose-6-phosphate 1-dehydrogenase n=1 Tax=Hondaea fermentalgiana TaxID=2315210 RepID=A0A2R5GDP6_9STRA|nr:Glucose-6-phosphate 1-dehydrogenase [Hondaea fermentalgiana]|eukprot:GBG26321.1 Glucose-6-phosphate 1-dehydrogenase [Hondaea fermentalgiana]